MKELSIEEKAKRYDDVRERIAIRFGSNVAKEIFSNYEESEDERVINNIKKVIGWYRGMFTEKSLMPEQYQEIDAWLEKQGEKAKYHDICDKCVRQPTCQSDCFLQ